LQEGVRGSKGRRKASILNTIRLKRKENKINGGIQRPARHLQGMVTKVTKGKGGHPSHTRKGHFTGAKGRKRKEEKKMAFKVEPITGGMTIHENKEGEGLKRKDQKSAPYKKEQGITL